MLSAMLGLLIAAVTAIWWFNRRPKNCPPGPPCFPIVGSVPLFGRRFEVTLLNWQKQYGDTFSFRIGQKLIIMINDYETAKKVLSDERTAGRAQDTLFAAQLVKHDIVHGLAFAENELWRDQRQFAISTLRELGMGKGWLEDAVLAEVEEVCKQLTNLNSTPTDPRALFSHGVSNVVSALILGKRFPHSDVKFTRFTGLVGATIRDIDHLFVLDAVPILKHIPSPVRDQWRALEVKQREILAFLNQLIDEHKNQSGNDHPDDFITAYLAESKKAGRETFTDFQLLASISDLFAGGTETSSTTLVWTILFMLENPEVHHQVHREMDGNIPRDKAITMVDRVKLPYTEATISEIQRLASLVPMNLARKNHEDMVIDGFDVPKGSMIMTNMFFMHRDPRNWNNPLKFDPNRFLDSDGKVKRPDGFLPFSIGKRACMGESLAKMELWLFIANILHRFNLEAVGNVPDSGKDFFFGMTMGPFPFNVTFKPRT